MNVRNGWDVVLRNNPGQKKREHLSTIARSSDIRQFSFLISLNSSCSPPLAAFLRVSLIGAGVLAPLRIGLRFACLTMVWWHSVCGKAWKGWKGWFARCFLRAGTRDFDKMKIVSAEIKPAMEHTAVEQTLFRKSLRFAKEGFKMSRRYAAPSDFFRLKINDASSFKMYRNSTPAFNIQCYRLSGYMRSASINQQEIIPTLRWLPSLIASTILAVISGTYRFTSATLLGPSSLKNIPERYNLETKAFGKRAV